MPTLACGRQNFRGSYAGGTGGLGVVLGSPRALYRDDSYNLVFVPVRDDGNESMVVLGVTNSGGVPAFVLTTFAGNVAPSAFAFTVDPAYPGSAVDLEWSTARPGVKVIGRIELPEGARDARFAARVVNTDASLAVHALEYPIVAGIRGLQPEGGSDVALQPVAMGYLVRDPWTNLPAQVKKRLYPDAYGGACVQLSAYYREGEGGFAMDARDPAGTAKHFSFFKDPANGDLRWSVETLAWDRRAGLGMDPGYEVHIAALGRGDWEEAADRYRAWALAPPWAPGGRVPSV